MKTFTKNNGGITIPFNTSANVTNLVDKLVNFSNDTFYKSFLAYSDVLGIQVFWTAIFLIIGIALAVHSRFHLTLLLAYFLAVNLFVAVFIMPLAILVFGIINALLAAIIIYKAFVGR